MMLSSLKKSGYKERKYVLFEKNNQIIKTQK